MLRKIGDAIAYDWHSFWAQVDFFNSNFLDWSGESWTVLVAGGVLCLWISAISN